MSRVFADLSLGGPGSGSSPVAACEVLITSASFARNAAASVECLVVLLDRCSSRAALPGMADGLIATSVGRGSMADGGTPVIHEIIPDYA
jgi:hypothetical protein